MTETIRRSLREVIHALRKPEGLLDISLVTERLAVGAAPRSIGAVAHLRRLGFTHIIDLRAQRKGSDVLTNTDDISVHWVLTYDDWKPKPALFFKQLRHEIDGTGLFDGDERLFIFCGSGEHRAPLAEALALLTMDYSLGLAIEMIQKARPVAEILPA